MEEETPKPDIFIPNYGALEEETPKPSEMRQDLIGIVSKF